MFQVPNFDPKDRVNRFEFQVPRKWFWESGKASIPFLHFIPLHVMKKARDLDKPLQLAEIATLVGERRAARLIRRLNQPEIRALEVAWLDASAVGLGESAASLSSSKSSGRQSVPTSSATGSDSTT